MLLPGIRRLLAFLGGVMTRWDLFSAQVPTQAQLEEVVVIL